MKFVKVFCRVLILVVAWCLLTGATYPLSKTKWADDMRQKVVEFRAKRHQRMLAEQNAQKQNEPNGPEAQKEPGAQNELGAQGEPRAQSETGVQNEPNAQNEADRPGKHGLRGENGSRGEKGPRGGRGPQGRDGFRGGHGPQGGNGSQRREGFHGGHGPQGGHGPHGGHGPSFGLASWCQLGEFLLYVFVPCFLLAAVLAVGKRWRAKTA